MTLAAAWQELATMVHSDSCRHWTHFCALWHGPDLGSPMNPLLLWCGTCYQLHYIWYKHL